MAKPKPAAKPSVSAKTNASPSKVVLPGIDVLIRDNFNAIKGKRVGLLTNPSGVNRAKLSTLEILRQAKDVKLVALFAAEHGLQANLPAGQEYPNATHPVYGLPIYSLYGPGPVRKPTPAMLKGLDALIYDMQDTGCRSYTFISTMGLAMEACAEAGVEFIVLDRPNPLGGLRVEGPMLDPRFRSLVGQWAIPYVYGLTCGELARMINRERWIKKPCRLSIVPMQGWRRNMTWADTRLAWTSTSPKIPHSNSPLYYVATGLLGTIGGVSIGFESNMPFECVAAPWLDAQRFSQQMNRYGLRGVRFHPLVFTGNKYVQQGIQMEFTEPAQAPLMAINFYALEAIKKLTGRNLYAQAVQAGRNFSLFDKVNGTDATRRALQANKSAASIVASWRAGEEAFRKKRQKYLLY